MSKEPTTLMEAVRYFADPDVCREYVASRRWADGPECPVCGSKSVTFLKSVNRYQCSKRHPKRQFTIKTGTIFEDSPLPLEKWLIATWLIVNAKNGISSYELHRALGVTQKTAWFMLHRIREGVRSGSFEKMGGHVEADETFIGGKAKNMHYGKRTVKGRGAVGKAVVMGLLERHGNVRALVVPNTKRNTLQTVIRTHVIPGSRISTDALASYGGLEKAYLHATIDHAEKYVEGEVHTNGLENFWSLLKRSIRGTYVSVDAYHLNRYLDEQVFRFNSRKDNDAGRLSSAVGSIAGRRLTYRELTGGVSAG